MKIDIKELLKKKLQPIYKFRYVVMIVYMLCDLFGLLQPFLLGKIIDQLANNTNTSKYLYIITVGVVIISFLFNWLQNYLWFKMIYTGTGITRSVLLSEVMKNDSSFFEKHANGDIMNRIIIDTAQYTEQLLITVPIAVLNVFTLLIVFAFLFSMNTVLAIVVILLSVIYFIYYKALNKKLKKYMRSERESFSGIMSTAQEVLDGMQTIQLYKSEKHFLKKYSDR
ncbi:ABC transporter ATP-binding protein, partial [Lachnospiraceae bacterium OttesenSCG-928-D06]|nr:ABC transporter ATP-binding protein [Lachnospiraceae bacterium OttesenSCG-928-D06]